MTQLQYKDSDLIILGVANGQFPRYVYKYRSLNPNTYDIFNKSELYFSKPKAFNDPFDCQIITETKNSLKEIEAFLIQNAPAMPLHNVKHFAANWYNRPLEWGEMVNNTIDEIINNSGIYCFAGSNDNILMWSHYTESNKGICIKFDLLADPDLFLLPIIIRYNKNYPFYNHIKDSSKITECLFKTKAECWSYEKEFRIIKPAHGYYKFNPKAIVEICFGCNASDEDIQNIKHIAHKNGLDHMKWAKAETSKSSFQIIIKDLE